MNIVKKVFQNSLWLGAAQIGSRGFGLIMVMILTRYLGAEGFGKYAFVYAYIDFFAILTVIGIDTIIVREASSDLKRAEVMVGNGIMIKAGFAAIAFVSAITIALAAGYPADKTGLITLAALSFLASPLTLYATVFPATLQLQYPAIIDLTGRTLSLLLVVFIVLAKGTLAHLFIALLVQVAFQAVLTIIFSRRFFRPAFHIDLKLCKWLLKETIPLAINNLLIIFILRIDQIMLERLHPDGDLQLGLYSPAVKYCEVFNLIPMIYFASVFPLLSRFSSDKKAHFHRLYHLSFKYLLLSAIPVSLLSMLHAEEIMTFLFGRNFAASAGAMKILVWSIPFVCMAWVLNNTITSMGRQRLLLPVVLTAAAANIALNLWLIPTHGAGGAAIASLISYALVLPLSTLLSPLRPFAAAFMHHAARPALIAFLLWALLIRLPINPILHVLIILLSFFLLMILTGVLNKEDLALLRRLSAHAD